MDMVEIFPDALFVVPRVDLAYDEVAGSAGGDPGGDVTRKDELALAPLDIDLIIRVSHELPNFPLPEKMR